VDASEAGIDDTYFDVVALALTNDLEVGSKGEQVPVYNCLDFKNKTGRDAFKFMERDKFETKLKNSYCIDMLNVEFAGNILRGKGLSISFNQCNSNKTDLVCKSKPEIDRAAKNTMLLTYAS